MLQGLSDIAEYGRRCHTGPDLEIGREPGIGTFEGYVGDGIECGASGDGGHNGVAIMYI